MPARSSSRHEKRSSLRPGNWRTFTCLLPLPFGLVRLVFFYAVFFAYPARNYISNRLTAITFKFFAQPHHLWRLTVQLHRVHECISWVTVLNLHANHHQSFPQQANLLVFFFCSLFFLVLAMHVNDMKVSGATHLFESSWKKLYTDRGIRKILQRYATAAGLTKTISPHKLRHFLFTWLKKQGLDDAMIQPYSGHASRQSLEIYSRMSLAVAQEEYDQAIKKFPV